MRMPKPLLDVHLPHDTGTTWIINIFQSFCEKFNESSSHLEREILSTVLHFLVDSSKDEVGVQWIWWDQDERKGRWTQALTHQPLWVSIMYPVLNNTQVYDILHQSHSLIRILPLWVHCVEYVSDAGELVFLRTRFDRLHESWRQWIPTRLHIISIVRRVPEEYH